MTEPPKSRLRQLLKKPEGQRVGRALASLLAMGVISIGILGVLLIWHAVRRGRLIQESLDPPRDVVLPDLTEPSSPSTDSPT